MDGFTPDTGVVFIERDEQSGFVKIRRGKAGDLIIKIEVNKPNVDARQKILQIHLSKRNGHVRHRYRETGKKLTRNDGA